MRVLEALRTGYACSEVWAREKHRIRHAQTGGAWGLLTRAEYFDMWLRRCVRLDISAH